MAMENVVRERFASLRLGEHEIRTLVRLVLREDRQGERV